MERPEQACRACGARAAAFLFLVKRNRVVRCSECTHVYLDVVHTRESISQMYEDYATRWEGGSKQYFRGIDDEVRRNLDDYLTRCRLERGAANGSLRLLDIGCGTGALLSRAQALGFACEGIEISKPLAHEVETRLGCRVHTEFLENLSLPQAGFDVITMYDLIEHLQDPGKELEIAYRILKPGGILFILTPNDAALARRIARFTYRASMHRVQKPMQKLYYVHHLSYFTAPSLTTLLRRTGFKPICIETRNQELSRLMLTEVEKMGVRLIFAASNRFSFMGGKLLAWARR